MKIFKILAILLGVAVLALAGIIIWQWDTIRYIAANAPVFAEGAEEAAKLKTADDLLEYIAARRDDVSLAAYRIGDAENGIFLNAEAKRPLASTMKILLLVEFARQADAGLLSPDEPAAMADVEAYYLPGTDGGAHTAALKRMREKGLLGEDGKTTLRHVVGAMMAESDNAATDYVLARLGRENVEALPALLGLPDEDAPLPPSGMFLLWKKLGDAALPSYDAAYADETHALAARMRGDAAFRKEQIKNYHKRRVGLRRDIACAHALAPKGTARGYAALMERIYNGTLFSESACALMREALEWPMAREEVREKFDAFGTKGGSLAGVLTFTAFAEAKDSGRPMAAALYFENMPMAVWINFSQGGTALRDFRRGLLADAEFFEKVKARLVPPPEAGPAGETTP